MSSIDTSTSTEIVRSRVAPCRLLHRRIGSAGESTGLVNDDRLMRI